MPTVAIVFGMAIQFFYADHDPPHFHVRGINFKAKIALADLSVIESVGSALAQDLRRIRAWGERHRAELWDNWNRARRMAPVAKIEGE